MKNPNEANQAKEKIRLLLEAQREIFFTGGIAENSEFYKNFQKTQEQVLACFQLEQRPLHYMMLFHYPFQPNHLLNKIAVETKAEWFYSDMVGKYFLGAYLATGFGNDCFGCFSVMDKVAHIHYRLSKRAEYLKKKGKF
jgi:hypothetical protein